MKFLVLTSILISIQCGLGVSESGEEEYPRVITPLGTIEGVYNTSSEGHRYESYLGIPYAEPITQERRFEVARPAVPWTGVLNAKAFGSSCTQIESTFENITPVLSGSEDCLYLNIYTPSMSHINRTEASNHLLPIIFFIHGGAFQYGSAALYGPDYLLDEQVILATINYRLGPLGFLSTEDNIVPGNMGLKDQVIAMRWIQDNIRSFRGDPGRVTLIGSSAGAASVHFHHMTEVTAGLFQRGLSISGTALDCWSVTDAPLEKAKKLATILGCTSGDVRDMVNCLKTRRAADITMASAYFTPWLNNPIDPFGPVVERVRSDFTIIDRPPIQSITTGRVHDLPWITTTVSQEGIALVALFANNDSLLKELNDNWEDIAPHYLLFNYTIPDCEKINVARLIRKHYLGTSPIDKSTVSQIIRMTSDRLIKYDAEKAARLHASAVQNQVRFGLFSYRGAHSASKVLIGTDTNYGTSHFDDVAYVLKSFFDPTTTRRDRRMQKVLIKFWVSYATYGNPDVGVDWPELVPEEREFHYLHIAGPHDIYMDGNFNFGDKRFWESIPFRENIIPPWNKIRVV